MNVGRWAASAAALAVMAALATGSADPDNPAGGMTQADRVGTSLPKVEGLWPGMTEEQMREVYADAEIEEVANGDVDSLERAHYTLERTGCVAVMSARECGLRFTCATVSPAEVYARFRVD